MTTHVSDDWDLLFDRMNYPLCIAQNLDPANVERLYGYAVHLYRTGAYAGAHAILILLLSLDASRFDFYLAMGLCCQKLDRQADAIFAFSMASMLQPSDPRPVFFSADSFAAMQEYTIARWAYGNAIAWAGSLEEMRVLKQEAQAKLTQLSGLED